MASARGRRPADWKIAKFKSWRHSGSSGDAGEAPHAAADAAGRCRLAEYLCARRSSSIKSSTTLNPAASSTALSATGAPAQLRGLFRLPIHRRAARSGSTEECAAGPLLWTTQQQEPRIAATGRRCHSGQSTTSQCPKNLGWAVTVRTRTQPCTPETNKRSFSAAVSDQPAITRRRPGVGFAHSSAKSSTFLRSARSSWSRSVRRR